MPKIGSKWTDQNGQTTFRVIHTIELDGHIWVHYCDDSNGEKEYSCYVESFLIRFTEVTN